MPRLAPSATYYGGGEDNNYFLRKDSGTVLEQPTLVTPISLESQDRQGDATIDVRGHQAGAAYAYTGAINLSPGASSAGPAANGVTIRAIADGAQVEIGTNSQDENKLMIAGPSGLSQVYDETYNQAVSLKPITMVSVNPLCAPNPANTSEIFRCAQAAVAAADAGIGQGNQFRVPKTGFYALQAEVSLFNAPAPAAPDINVPAVTAGAIDVLPSTPGAAAGTAPCPCAGWRPRSPWSTGPRSRRSRDRAAATATRPPGNPAR